MKTHAVSGPQHTQNWTVTTAETTTPPLPILTGNDSFKQLITGEQNLRQPAHFRHRCLQQAKNKRLRYIDNEINERVKKLLLVLREPFCFVILLVGWLVGCFCRVDRVKE